MEEEIGETQSGFRRGKGTREGIFNLRTILERYLEVQRDVYVCFIDYEKAFDRVYHDEIMKCFKMIDMDSKDKRLIGNLYWEQQATVRIDNGISSFFPIKRGVRQGCILSPKLFNLYTEKIFRESNEIKGCVIGGHNVNNLRYADDTALLAESEEELQKVVDQVKKNSEKMGLKMNVKKTKTMLVSRDHEKDRRNGVDRHVCIKVNGQILEQVKKFKYLGQWITEDGRCDLEVKTRIEMARSAFVKLRDVLTSKSVSLNTRKRLVRCYVLSTFLYASESWTLNKELEGRIEALEMWIYRRLLKISYKDRVTNEEVLSRVGEKRWLLKKVKQRKVAYFGHLIRARGYQRLLLEGKVEGVRRRGAPRNMWTRDIIKWTKLNYVECVRCADDRRKWRAMIANLGNEMAPD